MDPRDADRRRALRRLARRHHPDLGGDVEEYVAAVAALEARADAAERTGDPVEIRRAGALRRTARRMRRLVRALRAERLRRRRVAVDDRLSGGGPVPGRPRVGRRGRRGGGRGGSRGGGRR